MKRIKRIAGVAAGIFIFVLIVRGLNYIYVDEDEWYRILWHSFYEDKGKIDNLYLGSSHVYCDIDPFELDKLNGKYNFNLASPCQLMNGTYYLLKEADKYNGLSHVYVELYYVWNSKDNFNDNEEPIKTDTYRNWLNTDYMKLSFNKAEFMITMADTEKYPDVFFGFSRYRSNLDNWGIIKSTVEEKSQEDFINFEYRYDFPDGNGYDEYMPKGRFYSIREYQKKSRMFYQERILGENPIAETSEEYLRKVIEYCQKRDISITLFISPMYELQLISTENYDNYLNQVKEIAKEYSVDIYDFNLAKEEYLPIQNTKYFRDEGHLNSIGADMYTKFFHKVVTGNREENKKYFYDSYSQKLENTQPDVFGIYYHDNEPAEDGTILRNIFIASNRKSGMEYKITMTPDEGRERYMVQDFNENRAFVVNAGEHGVCTIVYRMKGTKDKMHTIEINY